MVIAVAQAKRMGGGGSLGRQSSGISRRALQKRGASPNLADVVWLDAELLGVDTTTKTISPACASTA